jgi:MIP family channel proteins
MLAEAFGAFLLTFVSAAPIVVAALTGELQNIDKVAPSGMVVAALIYTLGNVSGAHFNPAVTFAFALRRVFPWLYVPLYWAAQLVGAAAAGAAVFAMFGSTAHVGANMPHIGIAQSLAMEVLFSMLLVVVILGTANQHRIVGANAALAVGLTISLCGLVGGPVSGASMNPARSLGPALFGDGISVVWIYIVGPLLGAALGVLITWLIQGTPAEEEAEAAAGKDRKEQAEANL